MYHILYDKMTPQMRTRMLNHLIDLQPDVVNLVTERTADSAGYLQSILDNCPRTIVFERRVASPDGKQDEGIHLLPVDVWYAWRVTPYLELFQNRRVVVVYDNESADEDLTFYGEQMALAMEYADRDGVSLGVGRFSTGNPGEHQYAQLDAMWRALATGRHWWTPNEYLGPDGKSSAGHIGRFLLGWTRCDELNIPRPRTVIGELGVLQPTSQGLDPKKGYKSLGWSELDVADYVIYQMRRWLTRHGVTGCYFAAETDARKDKDWTDMTVGQTFYERMRLRKDEIDLDLWRLVMPMYPVEYDYAPTEIRLKNMGTSVNLNVREQPDRDSTPVGRVRDGDRVGMADVITGVDFMDKGNQWVPVKLADGTLGFVHAYFVALPDEPEPEEPPVGPTPAEVREAFKQDVLRAIDEFRGVVAGL